MKAPAAEWLLAGAYLAVLDVMRAKGEADGDTLSECVRDLINSHPAGRVLGTIVYTAGGVALYRHFFRRTA